MPLFEYSCRACGREFEELVFGDRKPECPGCGNPAPEQKHSVFAVGSGNSSRREPVGGGPCGSCPDGQGSGGCGLD